MRVILATLIAVLCAPPVLAAAPATPDQQLDHCLKKAEQLPDIAEADASAWLKRGGGDRARMCHATAEFNRGEFTDAGQEFASVAVLQDRINARDAAQLHAQSGLAFMRADDLKDAEAQYAAALRLEPSDPEIWIDRAAERAGAERYWDAIDDLNHALSIMPDDPQALRLRGQCWVKLNNVKNAQADFEHAEDAEGAAEMPSAPTGVSSSAPIPISTSQAVPAK